MGEVLKKFGRYFLLDQIAQGGMAEIYRARMAALDGAGRLIVIKRIQAGFGANSEFLKMFRDEIKVTMGFSHPNIVQLHDFGEEQNQPYIAMELVDGRNLRQFLSRYADIKQSFPVDLAAYIIEQAASALSYAHTFRDKISGESLHIVHRDISPQNILISYEGNVKVIDFGIAKAATNSEATRAGVIKGKPSYLSPEQITGESLDGRCDIFALGTVLWELLTGRKLFAGDNDLAVLKMIESCTNHVKPPSTVNPKVPKELDQIVMKALTKKRESRFQTADELQRALHRFLYSFNPDFNPNDLAFWAKELFKREIVEDRKLIQKLNEKVEKLLEADAQGQRDIPSLPGLVSSQQKEETTTIVDMKVGNGQSAGSFGARSIQGDMNAAVEMDVSYARVAAGTGTRRGASRTGIPRQEVESGGFGGILKGVGFGVAALLALAIAGPQVGINVPVASEKLAPVREKIFRKTEPVLVLEGDTSGVSEVLVNGRKVASSLPTTLRGMKSGVTFTVSVRGPKGEYQEKVQLEQGETKTVKVVLASRKEPENRIPANVAKIALTLVPSSQRARIWLDGQAVSPSDPVLYVSQGKSHELVVQLPGFQDYRYEFVQDASAPKESARTIELVPVQYGEVTLRSTPSADVRIEGEGMVWTGLSTPLMSKRLPPGNYQFYLTNSVLEMSKTLSIRVIEGRSGSEDVQLEIR